jgi:hypothetical protein
MLLLKADQCPYRTALRIIINIDTCDFRPMQSPVITIVCKRIRVHMLTQLGNNSIKILTVVYNLLLPVFGTCMFCYI